MFSIFSTYSILARIFSMFTRIFSFFNLDYSPLFYSILRSKITFPSGTSNVMHVPCILTKSHEVRPRGSSSNSARHVQLFYPFSQQSLHSNNEFLHSYKIFLHFLHFAGPGFGCRSTRMFRYHAHCVQNASVYSVAATSIVS
jgi:hypothetical protein